MKALALAVTILMSATLAHGADMKGMEMKDMSPTRMAKDTKDAKHVAKGTVKSVDAKARTAVLDHEPVKSMKWPAMTMTFKVQDSAMLEKLGTGKKVEFEFEERGKDYVITAVK